MNRPEYSDTDYQLNSIIYHLNGSCYNDSSIEDNDFDIRLSKATVNWMKGPVMEWLNANKLEMITPSKPISWESLTPKYMLGNTYAYPGWLGPGGYMNIDDGDEDKWIKKGILPLPKDEYPYTLIYSKPVNNFPVKSELLRELICLVEFTDLVSFSTASKIVFPEMIKNKEERPWDIIERMNLLQNNDDDEIVKIVKEVISKYPDKVDEYKNGKLGVLSLFMGDVMKVGKGKINPKKASEIVKKLLEI